MKRTFTSLLGAGLLVLLSLFLAAYTQVNAGRTEVYCEVIVRARTNSRFTAVIDYGRESKIPIEKLETRLVNGESSPFYSKIDILHHLNQEGWELVAVSDTDDTTPRYIMKRRL